MKITKSIAVAALALALVGGCAAAEAEPAPRAETSEATPTPEPEPTTQAPEPEPTTEEPTAAEPVWNESDYDSTWIVMELTWASTDQEAKDNICWGVNNLGIDWAVDTMLEGAGENNFNEDAIADFFTEVCS